MGELWVRLVKCLMICNESDTLGVWTWCCVMELGDGADGLGMLYITSKFMRENFENLVEGASSMLTPSPLIGI
jgi:hypothetical protein